MPVTAPRPPRDRSEAQAPAGAAADPLSRYRAGDRQAFEEIVEEHAPFIVRVFRRLGAEAATADDLAQEVFVRLIRAGSYESRGKLRVYLDRVARNVWIDHLRTRDSRPSTRSLDAPAPGGDALLRTLLAVPTAGPADVLAGADSGRVLNALVAKLPPGERLVFELAVFDRASYARVAATLGIPEGTVKSRMFHAVRRLRALASRSVEAGGFA